MRKTRPVKERFEEKYIPEPMSGCWLWMAYSGRDGYGSFGYQGRVQGAHRVSWQINVGEIPEGRLVLHKCDTPACVNPKHLFLGSNEDNMADMVSKGRAAKGSDHGGAALTEDEAKEIRSLSGSVPYRVIADLYSISTSQVGRIMLRENWKHV